MGVKKSTVCTRAISSVTLYTPASSAVEVSTKRFGSCCGGSSARACPNTVGLILEAQPAQATRLVSFHCFCLRNMILSLLGTSNTICWCHTVAYRTRFYPCFSTPWGEAGDLRRPRECTIICFESCSSFPATASAEGRQFNGASSPGTSEASYRLLRDRRTHDTVPVVVACRGAHWRVW